MQRRFPVLAGLTTSWMFMSVAVHAGIGGGFYYWFVVHQPPRIVADLDLSMAPLVPVTPKAGGAARRHNEEWFLPPHHKKTAVPPVPKTVETKQDVVKQEEQPVVPACPEPCPTTLAAKPGHGGTTEEGDYISADQATRKPRWIRNFITPSDYPRVAREQGKDGRVLLVVLIDATGKVRDARLLQGSYEPLNEVALRKVKDAVFSPAYDKQNKPVSCKVTLPIRFELR
jgi:protein TonB